LRSSHSTREACRSAGAHTSGSGSSMISLSSCHRPYQQVSELRRVVVVHTYALQAGKVTREAIVEAVGASVEEQRCLCFVRLALCVCVCASCVQQRAGVPLRLALAVAPAEATNRTRPRPARPRMRPPHPSRCAALLVDQSLRSTPEVALKSSNSSLSPSSSSSRLLLRRQWRRAPAAGRQAPLAQHAVVP